jgi:hypothetical protein
LEGLRWENVEIFYGHLKYFKDFWDILWPFGPISVHLVHFIQFWYQSGNPGFVHVLQTQLLNWLRSLLILLTQMHIVGMRCDEKSWQKRTIEAVKPSFIFKLLIRVTRFGRNSVHSLGNIVLQVHMYVKGDSFMSHIFADLQQWKTISSLKFS